METVKIEANGVNWCFTPSQPVRLYQGEETVKTEATILRRQWRQSKQKRHPQTAMETVKTEATILRRQWRRPKQKRPSSYGNGDGQNRSERRRSKEKRPFSDGNGEDKTEANGDGQNRSDRSQTATKTIKTEATFLRQQRRGSKQKAIKTKHLQPHSVRTSKTSAIRPSTFVRSTAEDQFCF